MNNKKTIELCETLCCDSARNLVYCDFSQLRQELYMQVRWMMRNVFVNV